MVAALGLCIWRLATRKPAPETPEFAPAVEADGIYQGNRLVARAMGVRPRMVEGQFEFSELRNGKTFAHDQAFVFRDYVLRLQDFTIVPGWKGYPTVMANAVCEIIQVL